MDAGVVFLNFGEPPTPDPDKVTDYLERIFLTNDELEAADSGTDPRERARTLAERRAPGLLEEYEAIGGSPLNEQAEDQARMLGSRAKVRGYRIRAYVGMQYADPLIEDVAAAMADDGVEHVIAVPAYPLCGPSTTVQALEDLGEAIAGVPDWDPRIDEVTGWHRHPAYNRLRVDAIDKACRVDDVDLADPGTTLVFSAHGTPQHYLEAGSRYVEYVEEFCETLAALLDVDEYVLGYQNHENRDIPWTEPAIESVISDLDTERIVVDPVSFIHEQSETLAELDIDLRAVAEDHDIDFHRVPIPHDDDRFGDVFLDLIEPFLGNFDPQYYGLGQCVCRERPGTMCLNAPE